jgi:hypothetical protein
MAPRSTLPADYARLRQLHGHPGFRRCPSVEGSPTRNNNPFAGLSISFWLQKILPLLRPRKSLRRLDITPEVRKGFPYYRFGGLGASLHLAHSHSALDRRDTEISQAILVGVCDQSSLCLFPDEKGSELIFHNLEKMAEILSNELVLLGYPIADGSKWTPPRHAKTLLQLDLRSKPAFESLPRRDVIVDRTGAGFDSLDVCLEYLMYQFVFIFEVVIELALTRP